MFLHSPVECGRSWRNWRNGRNGRNWRDGRNERNQNVVLNNLDV